MLFEFIRTLFNPPDKALEFIPKSGNILDVGCGHGIYSRFIASTKNRKVLGIDPSKEKINLANNSNKKSNLKYSACYLHELPLNKYDCIFISDVFYLLNTNEKKNMIIEAGKRLKKHGVLVINEVNTKPYWMYRLSYYEEIIMVKLISYTKSDNKKLYFKSDKYYENLLKSQGFIIEHKSKYFGKLFYPAHFVICAKKTKHRQTKY